MKTYLLTLAVCAVSLSAFADTFDIKTGAWDVTTSTATSGMLLPPDVLSKLTPEQRAKVEASEKARAGKVTTHTSHTCVTQEDLDHNDVFKSDEPNCTRKVISQSARHLEIEETCTGANSSKSHATFDTKSRDSYTLSIDRTMAAGQFHADLVGKWVSATCSHDDKD